MSPPLRILPPGLVAADGRRVRLGSYVALVNDPTRRGEVTGWAGARRGLEILFDDTETVELVHPTEIERVDEEMDSPATVGWLVVDEDPSPVLLVVPVGTRDLELTQSDGVFTPLIDRLDIRGWTQAINDVLARHPQTGRAALVADNFDAPMLRRVLDEASLPATVQRVMFVVTDQARPQRTDTIDVEPLLRLWLEGRGHLDPNSEVRFIEEISMPAVLTRLPHVLDAVVHALTPALTTAVNGCERVVTVIAGGTPATTYGTVIAASRIVGAARTRTVQVPGDWTVDGVPVGQTLIEMDVADSSLAAPGD